MNMLTSILIVAQVICALSIIVLVLLQHGKGADMGAAFGGGASGSLFGATGSANFLSRATAVAATLFFVATMGLAFTATSERTPRAQPTGVMGTIPAPEPAKDAPGAVPAPAAAPAAVPAPAAGKAGDIPVK
jgi:preprotein translocase subunit SecG